MDAFTTATRAAYKAITTLRAQGIYDNTLVWDAIAKSGISFAEATEVGQDAFNMALDIYKENHPERFISHEEHADLMRKKALGINAHDA